MGAGKKEAARRERETANGSRTAGLNNVKVRGENFYRDAKKVKNLKIREQGKPQRNASGKITKAASYQSREKPNARIEPSRRWFNNSRVISQDSLAQFRDAVAKSQSDPYSYLLKQNKLPMSLIRDEKTENGVKTHEAKIAVESRPFADTFGPKAQRKRVKLDVGSLEDLAGHSEKMHEEYLERREQADLLSGNAGNTGGKEEQTSENYDDGSLGTAREPIFSKGQSKRIWNELYKVIDSSDVIIHVLDARDPEGSRCRHVETYLKNEAPHKHLLFILNKCDLVKTSVAASWVKILSQEHPTLAFRSHITNSFGKGSLISILRQFSSLHSNRKQISVGFIGYPNTGKSSIINTLRKKPVCKVSPIPGQTIVWQYITLMKRIYLIDCPGVVPPDRKATDEDVLLRGAIRVENVENPSQYVPAVLRKCKPRHISRTYELKEGSYNDATEFLELLARKSGKLLKGGEADADTVAKSVLNDFIRGRIPWFVPPPGYEESAAKKTAREEGAKSGDVVRLNKMPTADLRNQAKRKRSEGGDDEEILPANEEDDLADEASESSEFSADSDGDAEEGESEGIALDVDSDQVDSEGESE